MRTASVPLQSFFHVSFCFHFVFILFSSTHYSGPKSKGYLKVIHRYGPCFQSKEDEVAVPNHIEIFLQDQSRVNSIQYSRLSKDSADSSKFRDSQAVTLPAKSGLKVGSANCIVAIGLGTPKRDLRLVFDTGSDLTWTQCQPCAGYCYNQVDPIFDLPNPHHIPTLHALRQHALNSPLSQVT
jgi:hypothetical protein